MSKVEVNQVTQQCGTTLTVGGGACKTAVVDATTVTLGRCGGTVSLASGATQSGFGRTGTVDWQTTPKTSTFTAVNGEGYFINSGSALTANLPAGSAGAIVSFSDYARNFATYNFSISANGSENIGGEVADAKLTVNGQAATFVYVDGTKGWVNTQNAEDTETGLPPFVAATGGNTTITCGDYKTHIFTGPGPFCVSNNGAAPGSNTVEYLVVAGGAGGGTGSGGGGGGAGGYRTTYPSPATGGLPVSIQCYPITVGAGGTATSTPPYPPAETNNGSNGIFSSITSTGGGGGGQEGTYSIGADGGSGGGGSYTGCSVGGSGNTPPTPVSQGNDGGDGGCSYGGGGGGGGSAVGVDHCGGSGGAGGAGTPLACAAIGPTSPTYGTPGPSPGRYFAGGGGGGGQSPGPTYGPGGAGGGGRGGYHPGPTGGTPGTINTGGAGGGGGGTTNSGTGGSGIVIIRYKFQ